MSDITRLRALVNLYLPPEAGVEAHAILDRCSSPSRREIDEEALIERTLFHISLCRQADRELSHHEHIPGENEQQVVGPACSKWADLLAAIMEGFERGWVEEAHLTRSDGLTHLNWRATDRGDRAMDAHRRRVQGADIVDESGDEA